MSQYFSKPYEPFGGDINFKVDLSNYATKTDLKNISNVSASSLALKSNLASSKLTPFPKNLAKLSNAVRNYVVKKTEYDKLVKKVDIIDTTGFARKTTYDIDKSDLEKKISDADKKILDTSVLAKKQI